MPWATSAQSRWSTRPSVPASPSSPTSRSRPSLAATRRLRKEAMNQEAHHRQPPNPAFGVSHTTEAIMSRRKVKAVYYKLLIVASSPATEIWLGDDAGHLVQKEIGELRTDLLPGD